MKSVKVGTYYIGHDGNSLVFSIEEAGVFNQSVLIATVALLEMRDIEYEIVDSVYHENKAYEEIRDVLDQQRNKGIEKYGVSVDNADLTDVEWAKHAREEVADLMVYLTKLIQKLEKR